MASLQASIVTMHAVDEAIHESHSAVVLRSPDGIEATYAPSVGMVGCSLRHDGDELLGQRGGLAKYAASGSTFGIPLLHPWANRLGSLEYEAAGRRVTLDPESPLLRLDPNGMPIHGLLNASPLWTVAETAAGGDAASLSAVLDFGAHQKLLEAFPFPHALRIDVRLAGSTLAIETTLSATGDTAVPVSFGYHPYFTLPGVPRADWLIELPVNRRLLLDERMIPTGDSEPVDEPPGPLGERSFDDGYADLSRPAVFALEGGGRRIEVEFGDGYRFAQVFAPPGQELICFEPMTAPTNALASGRDLSLVQPGASFKAAFEVRVGRV
jgi:galactose mutarotase-like enzyme